MASIVLILLGYINHCLYKLSVASSVTEVLFTIPGGVYPMSHRSSVPEGMAAASDVDACFRANVSFPMTKQPVTIPCLTWSISTCNHGDSMLHFVQTIEQGARQENWTSIHRRQTDTVRILPQECRMTFVDWKPRDTWMRVNQNSVVMFPDAFRVHQQPIGTEGMGTVSLQCGAKSPWRRTHYVQDLREQGGVVFRRGNGEKVVYNNTWFKFMVLGLSMEFGVGAGMVIGLVWRLFVWFRELAKRE
jgi:hypothetical protein